MTWTITDVGTLCIIITSAMFVVYLGVALHGMRHATIRLLGGGLLLLALLVVFMQVANVRYQLYKVELVNGATDDPAASASPLTVGGMLRSYAIRVDGAAVPRTSPAIHMQESAFTVDCTEGVHQTVSRSTARAVKYTDVRRISVFQNSGGGNALQADVLNNTVRYIVAAADTWRIKAVPADEVAIMFPANPLMYWCYDLARVNRADSMKVVPKSGRADEKTQCTASTIVLPFTATRTAHALSALDVLLGANSVVMLHVWGYGWQ